MLSRVIQTKVNVICPKPKAQADNIDRDLDNS